MTQKQQNFIRDNWINFSTLVIVIGFIWNQGKWQQNVDNHINKEYVEFKDLFIRHYDDKSSHMPFEDKIELFVPRVEIEARLTNIEVLLKEVRDEVKQRNR